MKKCLVLFLLLTAFRPMCYAQKNDVDALLPKAQAAFEAKSYKKCISLCNKILDRAPRSADAFYWKARALEAMNKPLDAVNEYRAALLSRPDFPEARENLTRVNTLLESDLASAPAVSSK